jgi:hypothetical protein
MSWYTLSHMRTVCAATDRELPDLELLGDILGAIISPRQFDSVYTEPTLEASAVLQVNAGSIFIIFDQIYYGARPCTQLYWSNTGANSPTT